MNLPTPQFQAIQEPEAFLSLWPHRFDFIYAEHPDPGDRPDWKTEDRHPLGDRLLQEGAYLYGVRFGKQTDYLVLDIDPGSLYHPHRDRLAIARLLAALVKCQLHRPLYCFNVLLALATTLSFPSLVSDRLKSKSKV